MIVAVVPMGDMPPSALATLSEALGQFGIRCEVRAPRAVPRGAYVPDRRQYRAEGVLAHLPRDAADRVLAVTSEDLFVPELNFVFGLAETGENRAIVSLHRLRTKDERLFVDRFVKEAIHELGHTWGLSHCENPRCVMRFSNSIVETDLKGPGFCPKCFRSLPFSVPEFGGSSD